MGYRETFREAFMLSFHIIPKMSPLDHLTVVRASERNVTNSRPKGLKKTRMPMSYMRLCGYLVVLKQLLLIATALLHSDS